MTIQDIALKKSSCAEKNHPICVGFDPDISDLHPFLQNEYQKSSPKTFLVQWFESVLTGCKEHSHSVKLQSAFFERFGAEGCMALRHSILAAKDARQFVILDAKRGDISSTMHAYGSAAYDCYQSDALTILPWMGTDSLLALMPWLQSGKFAYIVWLSSNSSGRLLQTRPSVENKNIAQHVFHDFYQLACDHHVESQIGWVLGATHIPFSILDTLPKRAHAFLLPGIGAQGASFQQDSVRLTIEHPDSLFPISRGILRPSTEDAITSWSDYAAMIKRRLRGYISAYQGAVSQYKL